ncbi:CHAP domain-containing protein [Gallaecimonas xiamenensis]|uniref:Trypanothione synthetase domain-containing protein n=1 Tax=Gallaecimonas xiamenensis 3-C-1 TaxID=745411 RepID=K2IZW6_9GAMM|nr:CHAP domain-containing protein [Gallaecimonas xiamenensis]EKE68102.1 trypanothione synthetase domain-containing protein [Gallaecimonas xiamenensis 3-C-1]
MNKKACLYLGLAALALFGGYKGATRLDPNPAHQVGEVLDNLDGVAVYYNGGVNHVLERNLAADGYNLGLKYQCVEFVKRYYYQQLGHKMPDSYGHAKDFFDKALASGSLNPKRGLYQYRNGEGELPAFGDILVFDASLLNPYGHVAIVSNLDLAAGHLEIIQQNPGPFSGSRAAFSIAVEDGKARVASSRLLGWLRKADPAVSQSSYSEVAL